MNKQLKGSIFLFFAALIWGTAFVAQSKGMDYIGAYSFNSIRCFIGTIVLFPAWLILRKVKKESGPIKNKRALIKGGVLCGIIMVVATNLQQQGLRFTTVGKSGFITALYIVIVPILGLFLHKKVGFNMIIGVVLAVVGLYLLCMTEKLTLGLGELLTLGCAIVYAFHILCIDHYSPMVDGVLLSLIQFLVCGVLSAIPMLIFETVTLSGVIACAVPLLYAGVMSCGVAYTFQILGQRDVNPTLASMICSLESVFSVLGGFVILGQKLSGRELLGCAVMFMAIIICQLKFEKKKEE